MARPITTCADASRVNRVKSLGPRDFVLVPMGSWQGRKVFTLKTPPASDPEDPIMGRVGQVAGLSLHAGVAARAPERDKLERLCRYLARPTISEQRLADRTRQGSL